MDSGPKIMFYRDLDFAYKGKQPAWKPLPPQQHGPFGLDESGLTTYIAAPAPTLYDRRSVVTQTTPFGLNALDPAEDPKLCLGVIHGRHMEHIGRPRARRAVPKVSKHESEQSTCLSFHNPHPLRKRVIASKTAPLAAALVSNKFLHQLKKQHGRFIPKPQPGERDESLLQQPQLLKKVRIPTVKSSCDQVEQIVKPTETQPLVIRHLPADLVIHPVTQQPVQAAVLVDGQSEFNRQPSPVRKLKPFHAGKPREYRFKPLNQSDTFAQKDQHAHQIGADVANKSGPVVPDTAFSRVTENEWLTADAQSGMDGQPITKSWHDLPHAHPASLVGQRSKHQQQQQQVTFYIVGDPVYQPIALVTTQRAEFVAPPLQLQRVQTQDIPAAPVSDRTAASSAGRVHSRTWTPRVVHANSSSSQMDRDSGNTSTSNASRRPSTAGAANSPYRRSLSSTREVVLNVPQQHAKSWRPSTSYGDSFGRPSR